MVHLNFWASRNVSFKLNLTALHHKKSYISYPRLQPGQNTQITLNLASADTWNLFDLHVNLKTWFFQCMQLASTHTPSSRMSDCSSWIPSQCAHCYQDCMLLPKTSTRCRRSSLYMQHNPAKVKCCCVQTSAHNSSQTWSSVLVWHGSALRSCPSLGGWLIAAQPFVFHWWMNLRQQRSDRFHRWQTRKWGSCGKQWPETL